jgi:hypothetical protein
VAVRAVRVGEGVVGGGFEGEEGLPMAVQYQRLDGHGRSGMIRNRCGYVN